MEEIIEFIQTKLESERQIGIQIGILEGIEEGQKREKIRIAQTMLEAGERNPKIEKYTNMNVKEVEEYIE